MVGMRISLALALVVLLAAPASAREFDGTVVQGKLGRELDEAIQRATKGGFWGAVLVAKKGKVLLAKGYGFADYRTTPNTPLTLFEIASTSKPFTAAAILKLQEQGKLKTSDAITRFFPDVPEDKRSMRVIHLLQHTSGLSNRVGVSYASTLSRKDYIAHVFKAPRAHTPGEYFAYNNAGYAILAAIVEVASGTSFEAYCEEHLFAPAGMKDTGFIQDKDLLGQKRAAERLGAGKAGISAVDWFWGWGYRGMGGVVTTVHDLLAFDRALRKGKLLKEETRDLYYEEGLSSYACGWRVDTSPTGGTTVSHSGGVQGFRCMYTRLLEDDIVVAVCTNDGGDPHLVAKTAQDLLLPPARVEATIDCSQVKLSEHRAAQWKTGMSWSATARGSTAVIQLLDPSKNAVATMRVPKAKLRGVIGELQRAIATRKRDDAGGPPAAEGGIYLNAYPKGSKTLELTEQLRIVVMPHYNRTDKRVTFVLLDDKHRMWTVIVRMNVAAGLELLAMLRKLR